MELKLYSLPKPLHLHIITYFHQVLDVSLNLLDTTTGCFVY